MKLFVFLSFVFPSICFAQSFTYNQGGTNAKNYYEEIPYKNINGKIILEGEIAGKKHRFLFDTGAPCALSKELAAELNAKVINKIEIHDTYLHTDSATVIELNDLTLGRITFNHIPAITLFPDFYTCWGIDGVIGSNLLRNSIVSIMSNKHIIVFTDQKNKLSLKAKNSAPLVSNIGSQSDPQIKIIIKNKLTLTIPFDTGDNGFLRVSDKMVADLKQYALFDTLTTGFGASGMSAMGMQNAAKKAQLKIAFFTVGNGRFDNLVVETNKEVIPAIGNKLLDYGNITLDFINGKFYFDANNNLTDLNEKLWPFNPGFNNGKFVIGVVWKKGEGLAKQGEQILAIDDTDFSNMSICTLLTAKPPLEGKDTAVLTLKDTQGNVHKVTMKKE
jgi:hypothetical protein